jgi:cytochrome c
MNRFMKVLVSLCVAFGVGVCHASAEDPTKDDAVKMVEKAVLFAKSNGKDKALAEINQKGGQFHHGELYVFVYDLQGTIVGHPINPKLVGKNMMEVPDPDGKFYRKTIVEVATTKGQGWVDYKYKNPDNNKIEAKTTYFQRGGDLIFAAGIYK